MTRPARQAPRGSLTRRIAMAIAVTAFVLSVAQGALAQETGAPWWNALEFPTQQAQAALLQNVRGMAASSLDSRLPSIPLDAWLFVTLAPRVAFMRPRFVEWRVDFCGPYARGANAPRVWSTGPELCAKGVVELSAEKNVHVIVLVAKADRGTLTWRPTAPSLREVYIEGVEERFTRLDSLDVPALGDLIDLLQVPSDQWPKLEFETQITWTPPMPAPGDTVRVSVSVRNSGRRAADRAWVHVLIGPCCDKRLEVRYDWYPYLAAGQSVRADFDVLMPEGRAWAHVDVEMGPSAKRVRETPENTDKRKLTVPIGVQPKLIRPQGAAGR